MTSTRAGSAMVDDPPFEAPPRGPATAHRNGRPALVAVLALVVTMTLWSSAFVGIRAALSAYNPPQLALLRFLIASAILAGFALATRMRLPRLADLPAIAVMGLVGITVYQVSLGYGEKSVSAGGASFIVASVPIFTALFATMFLGERLTLVGWLGVGISFVGVAAIALSQGDGVQFESGALLVLLAALAESIYFVTQKPYLRRYTGLQLASYTIWAATVFLLVGAPALGGQIRAAPLGATLAVVYLGVFPAAVAYGTWAFALSRTSAGNATAFLYLMPPITIGIGWVWLRELPSTLSLGGGVLAICGVLLVTGWGNHHSTTP